MISINGTYKNPPHSCLHNLSFRKKKYICSHSFSLHLSVIVNLLFWCCNVLNGGMKERARLPTTVHMMFSFICPQNVQLPGIWIKYLTLQLFMKCQCLTAKVLCSLFFLYYHCQQQDDSIMITVMEMFIFYFFLYVIILVKRIFGFPPPKECTARTACYNKKEKWTVLSTSVFPFKHNKERGCLFLLPWYSLFMYIEY